MERQKTMLSDDGCCRKLTKDPENLGYDIETIMLNRKKDNYQKKKKACRPNELPFRPNK